MTMHDIPVGIKLFQVISNKYPNQFLKLKRDIWYKLSVFVLTFLSYTCYHASRRPLSVVKTYFNRSCDSLIPPTNIIIDDTNRNTWCDWYPFYGPLASTLLGSLDSAFLFSYAVAMFISGFIAERVSLRYFLAVGMICSGFSCYLMGIAHSYNIHSIWYFVMVQIFGGIVQATGWPGVIAVMGNWFGKGKRGLIFGIWNSHTSIGNILGAIIASYYLKYDWGLSFMVPGAIMSVVGFILFLFLVESPADVGCPLPDFTRVPNTSVQDFEGPSDREEVSDNSVTQPLINQIPENGSANTHSRQHEKAIGLYGVLTIPGVIEFSLCLFFAKLVSYTILNWLPSYINSSTTLSGQLSSYLSTIFDVGGIVGGIAAGVVSDYTGMSATTCIVMLIPSIPFLFLYNIFGARTIWMNITMLILLGFFVNGPYALITTAVSAELGTHESLVSNSKALATVTAIIDGTGSIGAAVGPLLAGILHNLGWTAVFYMLIFSDVIAILMLIRLVKQEIGRARDMNSNN